MKFKYFLNILIIMMALVFNSCKNNPFDFNIQNIEADGEWGLPVYNGTLNIGDLLNNLDSVNKMSFGEDGKLIFSFENEVKNIISLRNLFRINDQQIDTSGTVVISHLPNLDVTQVIQFNLNTQDFQIQQAVLNSGQLSLNFNITNASFNYTTDLITGNILDAQGDSVSFHFDNSTSTASQSLANCTVLPNADGTVLFSARVIISNASENEQFQYNCHIELSDFSIYSVRGRVRPIAHHMEAVKPFNFHFNGIDFNTIQLNNAKTTIYGQNSICRVDGNLTDFRLFSHNGSIVPLVSNPINFIAAVSPYQYSYIHEIHLSPLMYTPDIDSLGIICDFNVNPLGFDAGDISIDENSVLNLKFKTELPANISIDNAVYKDTMANALYQTLDASTVQSIETLTLRIAYSNALPFDLIPDIEFWNTHSGEKYRLNLNNAQIHGGYNDIPFQQQPLYIELNGQDAQKIVNADKIIMNFRLNTQGNTVEIKSSQYINTSIGAKIKYSNINF